MSYTEFPTENYLVMVVFSEDLVLGGCITRVCWEKPCFKYTKIIWSEKIPMCMVLTMEFSLFCLLQELKTGNSGAGTDAGETTANNWQYFEDMHEVLGARPCMDPPVLVDAGAAEENIPTATVSIQPYITCSSWTIYLRMIC